MSRSRQRRPDGLPAPGAPRLLPLGATLFAERLLGLGMGLGMGLVGTVLAAWLGVRMVRRLHCAARCWRCCLPFFRIVGAGVSVVVSQALGGRRRDEADRTALVTLGASSSLGAVCVLLPVAGAGGAVDGRSGFAGHQRLGLVPRWPDWWQWRRVALRPVLHIGLPGAAENIAWRAGFVFSLSVVGQMGTAALATQA